jgi:hypothetical protein
MADGFTNDIISTHKWQHDHRVDCWLYIGHFRIPQMTARQWMAHVPMAKP